MTTRYSFAGGYAAAIYNPASSGMNTQGQSVDRFGNLWVVPPSPVLFDGVVQCISPSGVVLQALSRSNLINQICTFALAHQGGSSWISSGFSVEDSGEGATIVTEGGQSYLIFTFTKMQNGATLLVHNGISVWQLASDGGLTLLGVAWTFMSSLNSNYESSVYKIDLCGQKTLDDPIFVAYGLMGDEQAPFFRLWPSINEIISHVASGVNMNWSGFPGTVFNPGDTYHSFGISQALGINAGGDQACFVMPNGSGTDLLIYVSKNMMDTTSIPFITANLKPTYPDGCLTRTALPTASYTFTTGSLASPSIVNLPTPAAVSGAFVDTAGTPYDAFSDVGVSYDGGTGGFDATAEYYAVPRIVASNDDGSFDVGWYHPWFQNTTYVGSSWAIYDRLRLQRYDPTTALFTDIQMLQGAVATINQIGSAAGNPMDFLDYQGWALWNDDGELSIWHLDGPSATGSARWVTWRALIGREVIGQVTVHTRIGARAS